MAVAFSLSLSGGTAAASKSLLVFSSHIIQKLCGKAQVKN